MEWYYACWPRLTAKRVVPVVSISWASCSFTGRLPWQPAGIKFTQCVSGQKSAFSPLQEKLCVGSKNDWHNVLHQHAKFGGDRTTRAGCRSENWCFLYVTLGLPARGGHSSSKYCVTDYLSIFMRFSVFLWTHAQRCVHVIFCRCFFIFFFMPALVGQTAERIFTKLSHVVDIRCCLRTY